MTDFTPPAPGLSVTTAQTTSVAEPLDGPPVVYRSPTAARSWSMEYTHRSPFEVAHLIQLARHPGPLYLLDPFTTQTNMLPARVAEPGLMLRRNGEDVAGWDTGGDGRVLAGGTGYETSIITNGNFEDVSWWNAELAGLERDGLAHTWAPSALAANSGSHSLRAGFLAAGPAWQTLHSMVEVPLSRRVRISAWVRAGGGGAAPAPNATVSVALRMRRASGDEVTMTTVLSPTRMGHLPLWTSIEGMVTIPAGFDTFQTVIVFDDHAARGQAFVDDVSVIAEQAALNLDYTFSGFATTVDEQVLGERVPVRAGAWYTASIVIGGVADVRLYSYGATHERPAEVIGAQGWVTCTGQMPDGAEQAAICIIPRGGPAGFAQAQLTETTHHMPWHPGLGVPAVVLTEGHEHTASFINGTEMRGDYSFTITEVAAP